MDKAEVEDVEGAATVYEREEHKYVAEEKDFTQPQFFVAEEVQFFYIHVYHSYTFFNTYFFIFANL